MIPLAQAHKQAKLPYGVSKAVTVIREEMDGAGDQERTLEVLLILCLEWFAGCVRFITIHQLFM